MSRRLLLVSLLVAGCAQSPTATTPTVTPTTPLVTATAAALRTPTASPDRALCELTIDVSSHMQNVLLTAGESIGTSDMDRLVDETVEVAEGLADYMETVGYEDNLTFVRMHDAMVAINDSRLNHLTGDDTPFIEAIGEAAFTGAALRVVCS